MHRLDAGELVMQGSPPASLTTLRFFELRSSSWRLSGERHLPQIQVETLAQ